MPAEISLAKLSLSILTLLLLAVSLAASAPANSTEDTVELQILALNDFHGQLEPPSGNTILYYNSTKVPFKVETGGLAYLATEIKALQATNPNTIIVSAGDCVGASPFVSPVFRDEPTIEALNDIGVEYSAAGNHEFDKGVQELQRMQYGCSRPHRLLLPVERVEPFRAALMSEDGAQRVASAAVAPPPDTRHRVRRGENLTSISRQYGVPVDTLRQANNLRGSTIHPGDTLIIPGVPATGDGPTAAATQAEARPDIAAQLPERQRTTAAKPGVYTVKRGDTLWGIARKHGVTVPALASANGLSTTSPLTAGARLEIPGAGGKAPPGERARMTYKVRNGDTLSEIADRFNVSVRQIRGWNNPQTSSKIRAGQHLVIYVDPPRVNGG